MSSVPGGKSGPSTTAPSLGTAAIANPSKRKAYCLTICGYRKPGMSEEAFEDYIINTHARISKDCLSKNGFLRWTLTINDTESRKAMSRLYGSHFTKIADHDFYSQSVFEDLDVLAGLQDDPYYLEFIKNDHDNFVDQDRVRITVGLNTDCVIDGKAV